MSKIIKTKELNARYGIVLLQTHEKQSLGEFDLYDVEVRASNRTVVTAHTGCLGEKSGIFWMNTTIEFMERLLFLVDAREMACHNKLCYSTTLSMDTPKDGYEDEWLYEDEKIKMIEKWLADHAKYFGEKDDRTNLIRAEFDINEAWANR